MTRKALFLAIMLTLSFAAVATPAGDNIIPLDEARTYLNYKQPPTTCKNQTGPIDDPTSGDAVDSDGSDECENATEKRTSGAGSLIDNVRLAHYHTAVDFELPGPAGIPDCGGCGAGGSASQGVELPSLKIHRVHRYRDLHYNGSFGPGVFLNYDTFLKLSRRSPGGAGIIRVFDPASQVEHYCDDTDDEDGIYRENNYKAFASVTLYDADHQVVADQGDAATAELVTHGGRIYLFEIFRTSTDPETHNRWGRLIEIRDRNGNSIVVTHVFERDATDEELGYDRNRLWMKDNVTDAYDREASFAYAAETVSGGYVIERIDLPGDADLVYHYENEPLDLPGGDIVGLSAVDFPNGDRATFSTRLDEESQCQVVTYFDPAAPTPADRTKETYLTLEEWVDPRTHEVVPVSTGMIRMVVKGDDEVVYLAGSDPKRWGTTMVYEGGGFLYRYVTKGGYPVGTDYAVGWTWNPSSGFLTGDGDDPDKNWVRAAAYQVDDHRHVTGKSDELGRLTEFELDGKHSAIRSITYPDGTRITRDYNGFRQLTREVDRLNRVTELTYDARGNLLARTEAAGTPDEAVRSWAYNDLGLVETATDANGNVTEYTYSGGCLTALTELADEPGGERAVTRFVYDEAGRLAEKIDPEGAVVRFTYDGMNRLVLTAYDDGSSEETIYGTGDEAGLVKFTIDRNGNVTSFRHDGMGRLIGTIEAAGTPDRVRTSCTYLEGTRLTESETIRGETTLYEYDDRQRRVATTVYPDTETALTTLTAYDDGGRPGAVTDPFGRRTCFVYGADDNNLIRTVIETVAGGIPGGSDPRTLPRITAPDAPYLITESLYDDGDRVTSWIDGRGTTDLMTYDARGRLIEQVNAYGTAAEAKVEYDYDAQGNITEIRHPRHFAEPGDFRTICTYNGRNQLKSSTEAAGRLEEATVEYTYGLRGKLASETDARGNTTLFRYGLCCGRLKEIEDPLGYVRMFDYDFQGNRTGATDPLGHFTVAAYDGLHRLASLTNAEGEITIYTYDDDLTDGEGLDYRFAPWITDLNPGDGCDGSAKLTTDAEGGCRLSVRDGLGRTVRTATFDARGNALTFATADYDGAETLTGFGEVEKTTFLDGLWHTYGLLADGAGRTLASVDPEGFLTAYCYDANGNLVQTIDPNGAGIEYLYDDADRMVLRTDALGDTASFVYDSHDSPIYMYDGTGNNDVYVYDALDRRVVHTDREGGITTFEYDANGNRTGVIDQDAGETRWVYGELNRVEKKIFPDLGEKLYAYDAAGRLTARTDQSGGVTVYVYDDADRLVSREYPGSVADEFAYDEAGRLVRAGSGLFDNIVRRAHDAAGRLIGERITVDGRNYRVEYGYDLANRPVSVTYPGGGELIRTFSDRNLLSGLTFDGGFVQARDFDAGGRPVAVTYGNGLVETRTWRDDDLPETVQTPGVTDFTFGFDANKRKTVEANGVQPDLSLLFAYDCKDQLVDWERADGAAQQWLLSPAGDWDETIVDGVAETRLHDPAHELIRRDQAELLYDARGNMTMDEASTAYGWDMENRITDVYGLSESIEYAYDALGRRVKKTVDGNVTVFVHDGNQVLEEYVNGDREPARTYVYGSFIDEPVMMVVSTPAAGPGGNGPPRREENNYYYHADNMRLVTALSNQEGDVVERYAHRAYGLVTILPPSGEGPPLETSEVGNPYYFQGRRLDAETGLYYYRARCFHPGQGRFISRDPVGEVEWRQLHHGMFAMTTRPGAGSLEGVRDDPNPYLFAGNGPVNEIDPLGLWGDDVHGDLTTWWAWLVAGYTYQSAKAIGDADIAVDAGGTGPMPWQDQSYHFDRGGPAAGPWFNTMVSRWGLQGARNTDSRFSHFYTHLFRAIAAIKCPPDNPQLAAQELGTALHPLQDWVAHGDHAWTNPGAIGEIHNSRSPQRKFGKPGNYPDDKTLDALKGRHGRPEGRAVKIVTIRAGMAVRDYALYTKGRQRLDLTRTMTLGVLEYFKTQVELYGGPKSKTYFLGN